MNVSRNGLKYLFYCLFWAKLSIARAVNHTVAKLEVTSFLSIFMLQRFYVVQHSGESKNPAPSHKTGLTNFYFLGIDLLINKTESMSTLISKYQFRKSSFVVKNC